MEGSNEKLSHYYVFDGDDGRYSVDDSVQYFGNYFVDLDEGDLIVFDPGDEATMYPAPSTSTDPTAPYTNGCYRVGIDIPAGSYTITAATVGEGETDEDSAAFVMKNLDFDDDSIVDTKYVIPAASRRSRSATASTWNSSPPPPPPSLRGKGNHLRGRQCIRSVGGDLGRPFQPERFFLLMRGDRGRPLRRLTGGKGFLWRSS